MWCFQARIQEFTLVGAPWIGEGSGDRQQARIQEFMLVGAPWIGEGSGDRQGPKRVQGSARRGAPGGEGPRKLMRIRNLRR